MKEGKAKMEEKLVSVIIPTYNRASLICKAISSVLEQSHPKIEVVIIDDGSTDNTLEIIKKSFGEYLNREVKGKYISYYFKENTGISDTRNIGVEKAKGEYIAFVDSDDYWVRDKLKLQLEYLKEHTECQIVFTDWESFMYDEKAIPTPAQQELLDVNFDGCLPTLCCYKSVFAKYGVFDTRLKTGEDTEWLARLKLCKVPIAVIRQKLYRRLVHDDNITAGTIFTRQLQMRIMSMAFYNAKAIMKK